MSPWFKYDLEAIEQLFYTESGAGINNLKDFPDFPGLYLVFASSYDWKQVHSRKLAYVGVSTVSLKRRWKTHHLLPLLRFIETFGGVEFIVYYWAFLPDLIPHEMLKQWEADLIQRFEPPLNGRLACLVKSEFIFPV
jgi:hypothetical protein